MHIRQSQKEEKNPQLIKIFITSKKKKKRGKSWLVSYVKSCKMVIFIHEHFTKTASFTSHIIIPFSLIVKTSTSRNSVVQVPQEISTETTQSFPSDKHINPQARYQAGKSSELNLFDILFIYIYKHGKIRKKRRTEK